MSLIKSGKTWFFERFRAYDILQICMLWERFSGLTDINFEGMSSESLLTDYFGQAMRQPFSDEEEELLEVSRSET